MQFSSLFATLVISFVSVTSASVLPRSTLDVFVPTIISPDANTVWTMGEEAVVTWETSNAPVNISNGASVYLKDCKSSRLRVASDFQLTASFASDGVLAKGFSLRAGTVSFQVPFIPSTILNADEKHQIILFGDSGNISPLFTIKFDPEVFVSKALGQ